MEIDHSGWRDLDDRLAASKHQPPDLELLIEHVSHRLVAHFGADVVDCWLGKDGLRHHSMTEVAAAALAHLAPVLDTVPAETISALAHSGEIGSPMPPPWDDHWRTQPRTAAWRS